MTTLDTSRELIILPCGHWLQPTAADVAAAHLLVERFPGVAVGVAYVCPIDGPLPATVITSWTEASNATVAA